MFGSKKTAGTSGEVDTIIGKEAAFKGTINSNGGIRIDGQFEGEIASNGSLWVGDNAQITAEINVRNATIGGVIKGNVGVQEKLEILSTAKLYGDIKAGVVTIAEGAIFKGACEMHQESEE